MVIQTMIPSLAPAWPALPVGSKIWKQKECVLRAETPLKSNQKRLDVYHAKLENLVILPTTSNLEIVRPALPVGTKIRKHKECVLRAEMPLKSNQQLLPVYNANLENLAIQTMIPSLAPVWPALPVGTKMWKHKESVKRAETPLKSKQQLLHVYNARQDILVILPTTSNLEIVRPAVLAHTKTAHNRPNARIAKKEQSIWIPRKNAKNVP